MDEKIGTVEGTIVRWFEHGAGHPVVLVHGIPTSPRLWRRVMPLVHGRALAWEMTGYGSSIQEGTNRDLSLKAQAGYLLDWIQSLHLQDKPVLVGHDLGGGVAQIAAVRRPELFSGLVLTNSVAYDSWPIPSVKAMQRATGPLSHLPHPLLYPTFAQLLHRGHDDPQQARDAIAQYWPHYVAHGAAPSMMRQIEALNVHDTLEIADKLSHIGLPARVVWGEADAFQKVRYGERLAADLKTELVRIPGGKHFTPEDHPDVIAQAINSLISA